MDNGKIKILKFCNFNEFYLCRVRHRSRSGSPRERKKHRHRSRSPRDRNEYRRSEDYDGKYSREHRRR